jgi:hypothetical protein
LSLSLALAYAAATPALAEVSAAEAAKLGKSLTAMGAEAGPNFHESKPTPRMMKET